MEILENFVMPINASNGLKGSAYLTVAQKTAVIALEIGNAVLVPFINAAKGKYQAKTTKDRIAMEITVDPLYANRNYQVAAIPDRGVAILRLADTVVAAVPEVDPPAVS